MKQVQHIMDKYLMTKRAIFTIFAILPILISGCITQNYENDKTPVVQNQSNRNDMAATRISLGLGYLKMGNMSQAKQNLEKAKNFAPDMVQVYTAFAHYFETVGEDKQTVESYEKALSIKSDDADTLNNYGVYLCRKDQTEEAEKQFLKAIAVPSYILVAKSYENLASCFLQKDDFTKAEIYLNKAISHSPSSSSTLFQMVQLQYAMGDYNQAKLFEQRFSKVTRRFSPQSLALSYKVHYKLGQRAIAKNYGAMLVKMYPQSWESQQYLLNELELIEADRLATRYQESQQVNTLSDSKKRIVKLSPKKESKVIPEVKTPTEAIIAKNEINPIIDEASPLDAVQSQAVEEKQTIIKLENEVQDTMQPTVVLNAPITEDLQITPDENMVAGENRENSTEENSIEENSTEENSIEENSDNQITAAESLLDSEQAFDSEQMLASEQRIDAVKTNVVDEKQTIVKLTNEDQEIVKLTEALDAPISEHSQISPDQNMINEEGAAEIIEENYENQITATESLLDSEQALDSVQTYNVDEKQTIVKLANEAQDMVKAIVVLDAPILDHAQTKHDENIITEADQRVAQDEQPASQTESKNFPNFHVVSAGDTLYNISVRYNVKISALRRWNKMTKNKTLHIKDIIFLENPKLVNQ